MKLLTPLVAGAFALTASVANAGDAPTASKTDLASTSAISSASGVTAEPDARLAGRDVLGSACVPGIGAQAKLAKVTGPVVISQNGGSFKPAVSGVVVGPSDRIQVLKGGAGQLQRGNCSADLPRDGVVQLADASAPVQLAQAAPAAGGGVGTAGLVVGGLAIAGGLGAVVYLATKDSSP